MVRRFSFRYSLFIRLSDILLVIIALALSYILRTRINLGMEAVPETFVTPLPMFLIAVVLWQLSFQILGVYVPTHSAWLWQEIRHIILGHALACLLFFGTLYLTYRDFSRLQVFYFIVALLALLIAYRIAVRGIYKLLGGRTRDSRIVLIVGTDTHARQIGERVSLYAWAGLYLLGYVKHHPDDSVDEVVESKVLGTADGLAALVEAQHVDEIIVAYKTLEPAYLQHLIEQVQHCPVNIWVAPDYSDLAYFRVSMENFGGVPLIGLREAVLSPSQRIVKRLFDIVFSGLLLLTCWPLFLLIALAIRLDSPGPAIFRQERIGEYGQPFTMLKFRSMYIDAERWQDFQSVDHKHRDDPRVTRVGHFLRRTSLDELPQFINIFKGEMSLVGPRPEMPWLVEKYESWQRKRFEVPQGLTGWWQINGRADRPMYLNTEDDLYYIRNYSLWLDLQIILRTIATVIRGRGAY
jgi:exopolysaccharide biosynthesis polyprenyl glycosylphosphotransferase